MRNLVNMTQVNWLSKKVFIFQLNNQTVEKRISGLVKRLLVFTLTKSCVLNSSWSFPVLLDCFGTTERKSNLYDE